MLLMIDNYDSFTYNLVHYLRELGTIVQVARNDQITLADIVALKPDYIVISPGPGTPKQAGISLALIERFAGKIPIFGVCLGLQAIAEVYGGKIVRAKKVMHGKPSLVYHKDEGVFHGLANPMQATRYHSLVVEPGSLIDDFKITAWTASKAGHKDVIMGIKHRDLALEGVQFHPESILTNGGHALLANFLRQNKYVRHSQRYLENH